VRAPVGLHDRPAQRSAEHSSHIWAYAHSRECHSLMAGRWCIDVAGHVLAVVRTEAASCNAR
jgi:hypothetical protein